MQAYIILGYRQGDFPHTEEATNRVLSLPMFPELLDEEVRLVASITAKFLS